MTYRGLKAVVIGGSEGIGLALAQELVRRGADVLIVSRNAEKLARAEAQIQSQRDTSAQVKTLAADVTDFARLEERLRPACEEFGGPDLLINSAGVAHPEYLEKLSVAQLEQMMQLNALGPIYACKAVLPLMVQRGRGRILNVSSVAGYVGLFGYTGYCASKAAAIAFSEALREELIHTGVRVAVLCPPNTKTPGLERENRAKPAEVLATEEKVKVLAPEEVARYTLDRWSEKAFWIIPTLDSKLAWYLKRFLPGVLRRFVRRPKPCSKSSKGL